ncbi:DNA translocase FtsK [Duganella sp. FT135W]|uniref:DNA translocase FtsK n=1 Tax=Duganella flavida TaxID=2692175 RepID=A0A6L8KEJ8_9BURK|nr:FtsK/SpoIIIE domain-containing protein [Duganella flavida]MYM25505.1 DNA translocase FtsK [Duganella flavida]
MTLADRIVGRVGATILAQRLEDSKQDNESASLFRLDKLSAGQIASVVRDILDNPALAAKVDLKIPAVLVADEGLRADALTDLNAGAVRNGGTSKEALLTANGNEHNLADTLGHVTALGAKEFRANADAWVDATCSVAGITLTADDRLVFRASLKGLIGASEFSLAQLGDFCETISEANRVSGHAIRNAIGWALPCVGLPRDTPLFANSRTYGQSVTPWRKAFEKLVLSRAPLLSKLRANGQPLDTEEMTARLNESAEIKEHARPVIAAFINASQNEDTAAAAFAQLEWELDGAYLIFDKPRDRQLGLAAATLQFFDYEFDKPDALDVRWKKHLEDMGAREKKTESVEEEDEEFYQLHRQYLEHNKALHSRWEKLIFGKPVECSDFLEGFMSVAHQLVLSAGEAKHERILRFSANKGRKEWREKFNHDVGAYFSSMYRGLKELMGAKVQWTAWKTESAKTAELPDPLFSYPAFFENERNSYKGKADIKEVTSLARPAMQIRFDVSLIERSKAGEEVVGKTQLIWTFKPDAIGLALVDDMDRLLKAGGIACTDVPRRLVSKKGGVQSVSLLDTSTLEATFNRDAGSLVPSSSRIKSLKIKQRINELTSEGRISPEHKKELLATWETFETDYVSALGDFIKSGLHSESILRQAESFGRLLTMLTTHARGDVCRSKLVSEILSISTVRVLGDQPSLIIPPWHPERMKALAVKIRRVAGLVSHFLTTEVQFGDRGIFFHEFAEELSHPFYPEVAVMNRGSTPVLVSEAGTLNGYSLLERPVREADDSLTDADPLAASKQVRELLERYITLQPHEANDLNVLLYNSDAAELPLAVVRELSGMQTDAAFQCGVSIRHRDPEKLRQVYAELVSQSGDDQNLPVVSETSENFISKLRVSVSPASSTPLAGEDGFKPFDVAFLHDVVSRTASIEWLPVEWANDRPTLEHAPSRWSYRSVSGENELKSTTFLTCPCQTSTGWAYINAVAAVDRQTDTPDGARFLPARRISLQSSELSDTMNDAHALAEWVATYDELLDKRQLQANDITVVRYRRASTNGRNMIVSSTSELRLLSVLVRRRLAELAPDLESPKLDEITHRMKKDALSISGDVVLRAAKRGVSAGEMTGLVLSRYLLENEFKKIANVSNSRSLSVFFLLDDYAGWLAQKESRIADILGLCVQEVDGKVHLHIAVVESKYVSYLNAAEAKRSSKSQLMATLSTFRAALFGAPGRLDRDVWLGRLADLLIDADIPPGSSGLLERARASLRDGAAGLSLRGYSHVFVHSTDPGGTQIECEQVELDETDGFHAWQEVFDRATVRELLFAYASKDDPSPIREKLGSERPWNNVEIREPAERVEWSALIEQLPSLAEKEDEPRAGVLEKNHVAPQPQISVLDVGSTELIREASVPQVIDVSASASDTEGHLSLLIKAKASSASGMVDERATWAEDITKKLKAALNGYGLQAAVLGTRLTPNGCLVRLAGSDRLRVEDVEAKRMQLLTTHAISLVTVQPKPGEIVVSIASERRQAVSLWDIWATRAINRNSAGINTSFVLGLQEVNGAVLYLNLGGEFGGLGGHDPHALVAGTTGSGKSVLIQALMLDIAATNPKDLAQIVLIDPKMGVDYSALEDLPHMREPIITTRERSTEVLKSLVDEMEARYKRFAEVRARDLKTYNMKMTLADRLPLVFLVHDEFADWMLDDNYKSDVSAAVQRLGVKARAAGIHLIFAAQRPDKDVMPMQLRDNLGSRLILKVSSEATSKIALDRPGAELLLGRGHMAAKLNGEQGLVFAQAPFLSDDDIALAVEAIRKDNA